MFSESLAVISLSGEKLAEGTMVTDFSSSLYVISSISTFQFNGWHLLEKKNVMVNAMELNP